MYTKDPIGYDFKNPPYVPNELLVTLEPEAQSKVSKFIPIGTNAQFHLSGTTATGITNIDAFLKKNNCVAITKLHGLIAESRSKISAFAMESAAEVSREYRIRFDKDKTKNIKKICGDFSKIKGVKDVSLNYFNFAFAITPNDPDYAQQWGLSKMNMPEAWECTTGTSSVVVAIVDSGVDLNHPDLTSNLISGRDLIDLSPNGLNNGDVITISGQQWMIEDDVLAPDNSPGDRTGHGTHVAGTVGAMSNNNTGVTGVAWGCSLMPVKGLFRVRRLSDNQVTGVGTDADIAAAITWAANNGAHIINMSLGGPNSTAKQNAINFAISQGCLCVAAMGNDNTSTPSYPAAYPGVLAVGAVDNTDSRAWFSNFGSHISVVAPGVNIRSTYWDDTYDDLNGTSMACPHVAGLAALLKSADSTLTASQIKTIIEQTATPLKDNAADPIPNDQYGYGLVNAKKALDRVCNKIKPTKPWLDKLTRYPEVITKPWLDKLTKYPELITKPWLDKLPTKPWLDNFPTNPAIDIRKKPWDDFGTLPSIDHRKHVALDKRPGSDLHMPPRDIAPFVLSTPHHYEDAYAEYEDAYGLDEVTQIFEEAKIAYEKGELNEEDMAQLDKLYIEYFGS
ncbi:hypothetical protein MHTCC0001_33120 [Flavobacteriaceae bacterium MHTCC 0001]